MNPGYRAFPHQYKRREQGHQMVAPSHHHCHGCTCHGPSTIRATAPGKKNVIHARGSRDCTRCGKIMGKNHYESCYAKNKRCFFCNRQGHLIQFCFFRLKAVASHGNRHISTPANNISRNYRSHSLLVKDQSHKGPVSRGSVFTNKSAGYIHIEANHQHPGLYSSRPTSHVGQHLSYRNAVKMPPRSAPQNFENVVTVCSSKSDCGAQNHKQNQKSKLENPSKDNSSASTLVKSDLPFASVDPASFSDLMEPASSIKTELKTVKSKLRQAKTLVRCQSPLEIEKNHDMAITKSMKIETSEIACQTDLEVLPENHESVSENEKGQSDLVASLRNSLFESELQLAKLNEEVKLHFDTVFKQETENIMLQEENSKLKASISNVNPTDLNRLKIENNILEQKYREIQQSKIHFETLYNNVLSQPAYSQGAVPPCNSRPNYCYGRY